MRVQLNEERIVIPNQKHLSLLGLKVEDKVSGLQGEVASVAFDIHGCVQAVVNPCMGKDSKFEDRIWIDVNRLKVLNKKLYIRCWHGPSPKLTTRLNALTSQKFDKDTWIFNGTFDEFIDKWQDKFLVYKQDNNWNIYVTDHNNFGQR